MKILHVISSLDPAAGGPPLVAIRLAAAHSRLGHHATVLSYSAAGASARIESSLKRVPDVGNVKVRFLPHCTRVESLFANDAREILSSILPETDWIHIHGVWERLLKVTADMAYRAGVPYCYRPAGMLDPWSLNQKAWKKKIALSMGYHRSLSRAAFIHALNSAEAELLGPLNLETSVEVFPNGIFHEEVFPLPERGSFRTRFPILGSHRYILFLGRLHMKKGLDYLLGAFGLLAEEFPELRLVIAGPDDGSGEWLESELRRASYRERVLLTGPLYGADKYSAYVDASIFCLPSRQEGFSVAVIEALASGVPVVISEATHFPEVATSGSGIVVNLSNKEVADALATILRNPKLSESMAHAGKALITESYLWDVIARDTVTAYEKYIQNVNA